MRIDEIVTRHLAVGGRVAVEPGDDAMDAFLASAGRERVGVNDVRDGDVLLVLLDGDQTVADVRSVVDGALSRGGTAAVLGTVALEDLAIGEVLDVVLSSKGWVVEAVPVEQARFTSAVVAAPAGSGRLYAFLTDEVLDPSSDATMLRLASEWTLTGLRLRALEQRLAQVTSERDALGDRVEELGAQISTQAADASTTAERLAEAQRRADALQTSPAMQLGTAMGDVARHPVKGSMALPGAFRRVRRERRSRANGKP